MKLDRWARLFLSLAGRLEESYHQLQGFLKIENFSNYEDMILEPMISSRLG